MPRPLVATIHLSAMRHNLSVAKSRSIKAGIWAVVKADAYGHGIERAMRGFTEADGLSLVEFDKAVALRQAGWRKPILLLEGCFDTADLRTACQYRFHITVHCTEQLNAIEQAMQVGEIKAPLDIYLKLNSGMNRLGFAPTAFRAAHARLRALPMIRNIALMTHFANAEAPENPALPLAQQLDCFAKTIIGLEGERSVANSATDLLHPALAADWARPGIMLYGGSPSSDPAQAFGLFPAMTLSSQIIGTQTIKAGEAVGYGSRFIAAHAMRVGVVACGYADGYPRQAPDGTPVIVDGVATRLIGRVSMDMLMVDLTPIPQAGVGTPVVLWGRGLPIDDVASKAGTIGYELMCALAPRVRVEEDNSELAPTTVATGSTLPL